MADISHMIEDFITKVLFPLGTLHKSLLLTYNVNIESTNGKKELHHL